MYKSPIEIAYGQLQTKMEGDVFRAIQSYDINVDKDELIKALAYDREQYNAGYTDGYMDAMDSIVRCKDCAYANESGTICMYDVGRATKPMGYCDKGERKGDCCG